ARLPRKSYCRWKRAADWPLLQVPAPRVARTCSPRPGWGNEGADYKSAPHGGTYLTRGACTTVRCACTTTRGECTTVWCSCTTAWCKRTGVWCKRTRVWCTCTRVWCKRTRVGARCSSDPAHLIEADDRASGALEAKSLEATRTVSGGASASERPPGIG